MSRHSTPTPPGSLRTTQAGSERSGGSSPDTHSVTTRLVCSGRSNAVSMCAPLMLALRIVPRPTVLASTFSRTASSSGTRDPKRMLVESIFLLLFREDCIVDTRVSLRRLWIDRDTARNAGDYAYVAVALCAQPEAYAVYHVYEGATAVDRTLNEQRVTECASDTVNAMRSEP